MKKFLVLLLIISLSLSSVAAIDFGGIIDNTTASTAQPDNIVRNLANDTKVTAWISSPFDRNRKSFFIAEGYYNLNASSFDTSAKVINTVDLSLLKFSIDIDISDSFKTTFNLGRYILSDLTSSIFSQSIDGLLLTANTPIITASLFAGYTGLLNAKTVSFYTLKPTEFDNSKLYIKAADCFIASANISFPSVVFNQTPSIEVFETIDFNEDGYNKAYMTASLNGPIVGLLFYNVSSTLGLSSLTSKNEWSTSNLTKANLSFYPKLMSSSLALNFAFATGGDNQTFQPFTSSSISIVSHTMSNVLKTGISGSIKPIQFLLITANADVLLTANNESEQNKTTYDGFQWQSSISVQPLSDIQIIGSFGQFIANSGNSTIQFSAKVTLSL